MKTWSNQKAWLFNRTKIFFCDGKENKQSFQISESQKHGSYLEDLFSSNVE